MGAFLDFSNVSFAYHTKAGETPALNNVSFQVEQGEFVSVVGPSGCGKSTILSLIAGLLVPEEGSISVSGENTGIGYMLQKDHLFEWRSVYKNCILGLEIRKQKTEENLMRVENMLIQYGLMPFRNARPSELSGGLRQRAALIRTLALNPQLLLLDEPFSALDYQTRLAVGSDICEIIRNEHKTALLVTHDLSEAITLGSRILVLSKRPTRIIYDAGIQFPEGLSALQKRNTKEFQDYFQTVWEVLNNGKA